MPIPSQPKTFGLENCRDLHRKLEWEINGLEKANPRRDPDELAFRAFNAFVTAWHLADWVWGDMTERQRDEVRKDWGEPHMRSGNDFRGKLRKRERALGICREIATASKHMEVKQNPDDTVDASVSAGTEPVTDKSGVMMTSDNGEENIRRKWVLKVLDGSKWRPVMDLLEEALTFWDQFIYVKYDVAKGGSHP